MKEHIRFSIFRINTIQTIDVTREKKSKSFQVVGWFYNFYRTRHIYIYILRSHQKFPDCYWQFYKPINIEQCCAWLNSGMSYL